MENIIIKQADIEQYGDDLRAVIRAFADIIANHTLKPHNRNDKNNLEYLINEINYIIKYEL